MTGEVMGVMRCADCKKGFMACPECVNVVRIDPETGLPPDVVVLDGEARHNPNPDPAAFERSVKQPVCDDCVAYRNELTRAGSERARHHDGTVMLAADRHRMHHR
ncbi:hypothetical protein GCM10027168_01740 [Streptomyces capparidis]